MLSQWVSKAYKYYNDINPSTLSGAIDIIVVERTTPTGEIELACSPFHVRFGKLSVLRPIDKKVTVKVNDKEIPFVMKVGITGEAFFVFEIEGDVPEEMQTSPLVKPADSDDVALDDPELEPFELGAPETSLRLNEQLESGYSSPGTPDSDYRSFNPTARNSPAGTLKILKPLTMVFERPPHTRDHSDDYFECHTHDKHFESPIAIARSPLTARPHFADTDGETDTESEKDTSGNNILTNVGSALSAGSGLGLIATGKAVEKARNGISHLHGQDETDEFEKYSKGSKIPTDKFLEDVSGKLRLGHGIDRGSAFSDTMTIRPFEEDVAPLLFSPKIDGPDAKDNEYKSVEFKEDMTAALGTSGSLMLDVSGYKVDPQESEANVKEIEEHGSHVPENALDDKSIVAFTQALLQSTDQQTLRGLFDLSDDKSNAPSPTQSDDEDESAPSRPKSPIPAETISELMTIAPGQEASPNGSLMPSESHQFLLRVGEKSFMFELSLCGVPDFGHDLAKEDEEFDKHRVSFDDFLSQEDIIEKPTLIVKYGGKCLNWNNASPVLASLLVYRKSLVDHPELHRYIHVTSANAVETGSRRRAWGSWFRKSTSSSAVTPSPIAASSKFKSPTPESLMSRPVNQEEPTSALFTLQPELEKHYAKTLRLTSEQLKQLELKKGMNTISFSVSSSYSGIATCNARIFLWESDFNVVISDIDGTITKSDALGHVFAMIGRDWTHQGVAKLYTDIAKNGYKIMYLTARAIGQADTTREFLKTIKQDGFVLPDGPVIMSPDRLMEALHREVIMRQPEVFKMACLRDIQRLFHDHSPFYAGFGNRITDAFSYRSVDIPSSRIFTIDPNGEVKTELLELAGYKSSYIHMSDLVNEMFPLISQTVTAPAYTDFEYWRVPMQEFELPDLSPPTSPALSARSDSSRIPFARLGSRVASTLSRRSSRGTLGMDTPSSPPVISPMVLTEEPEDFEGLDDYTKAETESMPGSLPEVDSFTFYRKQAGKPTEDDAVDDVNNVEDEVEDDEGDGYQYEEQEDEFGDQLDFSSVPYL